MSKSSFVLVTNTRNYWESHSVPDVRLFDNWDQALISAFEFDVEGTDQEIPDELPENGYDLEEWLAGRDHIHYKFEAGKLAYWVYHNGDGDVTVLVRKVEMEAR